LQSFIHAVSEDDWQWRVHILAQLSSLMYTDRAAFSWSDGAFMLSSRGQCGAYTVAGCVDSSAGFLQPTTSFCVLTSAQYDADILVFRGSLDEASLSDGGGTFPLSAVPRIEGAHVRSRFHESYFSTGAAAAVRELLAKISRPLWVTGHASGGSLATLAAFDLAMMVSDALGPLLL
jgi:hypothetical protein